jgi:hypothetical protein
VVSRTLMDFYVDKKLFQLATKPLPLIKEKSPFPWKSSLEEEYVLNTVGFRWKICQSKRAILIKRPNIFEWQCGYLFKLYEF